jgi:hypothetical protein
MTTIQVDSSMPYAARIFVNENLVIFQPYNPDGGAEWASEGEARSWAESVAQTNVSDGIWPSISES